MRGKSAVLGMAAAAAFSSAAIAAPCAETSLTKYTAPGFSCKISGRTFSNFIYSNGDKEFSAADTTVIPMKSSTDPGILFQSDWALPKKETGDFALVFDVKASPSKPIDDASLALTGSAKGKGFAIDSETILSGGIQIANLTASITKSEHHAGHVTFGPVTSITVEEDIVLRGKETLSLIDKRFSDVERVPEPTSLALIGVGLGALGVARRRKRAARS